ncbi:hypothetical protein NE237_006664 [Protea cynaroides]|uniref:Uncharacterized protein n=1 Tax=Protea cynaroides TaxID=273540 RepID=A0A9Q0KMZ8_9MAGN|nr:hypothetical protein NE237_006664 [Protea cynaroides]
MSDVPQLMQEIQDKLAKDAVECMICIGIVRGSAPIWSCSNCYSIFHLKCIKNWARAPTSIDLSVEKNQGVNWCCPGCQSVQQLTAKEIRYVCFCGKQPDPRMDLYRTPHSCGEPCGKPLEREDSNDDDRCPHVCVLQCHPGPCPPCKAFTPRCPCGKKTFTMRCSDWKPMVSCEEPCNKLLECGRHSCDRICHYGQCDPCLILMKGSCFCDKKEEFLLCEEMVWKGDVKQNDSKHYSCNSDCGKKLACGKHFCSEICHFGPCGDCKLTPCVDDMYPIPTCSQIYDGPMSERRTPNNKELISGSNSAIDALVKSVAQLEHNAEKADAARTKAEKESRAVANKAEHVMNKVKRLRDIGSAYRASVHEGEKKLKVAELEKLEMVARADKAEKKLNVAEATLKATKLERAHIAAWADKAEKTLKATELEKLEMVARADKAEKKLNVAEATLKATKLERAHIAAWADKAEETLKATELEKLEMVARADKTEKKLNVAEATLKATKLERAHIAAWADKAEETLKATELEKVRIAARADKAEKKLKVAEDTLKATELEKVHIAARANKAEKKLKMAEEALKATELEKVHIAARANKAQKKLKVADEMLKAAEPESEPEPEKVDIVVWIDKAEKKLKVAEETLKAAEVEKADIRTWRIADYMESWTKILLCRPVLQ